MKREKRSVTVGGRGSGTSVDIMIDLPESNDEFKSRFDISAHEIALRESTTNVYDAVRRAYTGTKTAQPIRGAAELQKIADDFRYGKPRAKGARTPQGQVAAKIKKLDENVALGMGTLADLAQNDPEAFAALVAKAKKGKK